MSVITTKRPVKVQLIVETTRTVTINKNNAACAVLSANDWANARPLLRQLHWVPVRQRIFYKTAVLMHRVNTTDVTAY